LLILNSIAKYLQKNWKRNKEKCLFSKTKKENKRLKVSVSHRKVVLYERKQALFLGKTSTFIRENKAENQEKHPQKQEKTGFKSPQSLLFRTF